jgi:hypothetical protein
MLYCPIVVDGIFTNIVSARVPSEVTQTLTAAHTTRTLTRFKKYVTTATNLMPNLFRHLRHSTVIGLRPLYSTTAATTMPTMAHFTVSSMTGAVLDTALRRWYTTRQY